MIKLRSLMIVVTVFSITSVIVIVSLFMFDNTSEIIDEEASQYLELQAVKIGHDVEKVISEIELKINTFSLLVSNTVDLDKILEEDDSDYFDKMKPDLEKEVLAFAENFKDNYDLYIVFNTDLTKNIEEILFVREKGDYVQIDHLLRPEDMVESDEMKWYFDPIKNKEGQWTEPYDDLFLNQRLMTYSAPIIVDGTVVAIIGIDILFDQFERMIESIQVYDSGYAFLFNKDYRYLVHPLFSYVDTLMDVEDGAYAYMKEYFDASDTGVIKYDFFNEDKILGFYRLNNDWVVAVAPPYNEVFKSVDVMKKNTSIIVFIGITSAVIILSIVSHLLTAPIQSLSQQITAIGHGMLSYPISDKAINNKTELGLLARAVEKMRQELNNAFTEIKETNETLDKKVIARTQELYALNQELVASLETIENMQEEHLASEKNILVRSMVSNIAHKMNTPIGTSITLISYLSKLSSKLEGPLLDQFNSSLDLLLNNQNEMKDVIEQMRHYLDPYDGLEYRSFDILKSFEIVIHEDKTTRSKFSQNVTIDVSGKKVVHHSQKHLNLLFKWLLEYSNKIESNDNRNIHVQINTDTEVIEIIYYDPRIELIGEKERMFDPYHLHNFTDSKMGLDLNLIGDLVIRGLHGQIQISTIYEYENAVHIVLPTR